MILDNNASYNTTNCKSIIGLLNLFFRKKETTAFSANADRNISPDSGNIKCGEKSICENQGVACVSYSKTSEFLRISQFLEK